MDEKNDNSDYFKRVMQEQGVHPTDVDELEKKVHDTLQTKIVSVTRSNHSTGDNQYNVQIVDLSTNNSGEIKLAGVSDRNLRELSNGHKAIDENLDLHGYMCEEALKKLENTIQNMFIHRLRILRIVHGRGVHSEQGRPVLKQAVLSYLCHGLSRFVLAVVPAPRSRGGASLVWLKKRK